LAVVKRPFMLYATARGTGFRAGALASGL